MRSIALSFSLLFVVFTGFAQRSLVKGQIIDNTTREPLAFVHILINDSRRGTTSDINGRFVLNASEPIETISFSYVGYKKLRLNVDSYLRTHRNLSREFFLVRMEEDLTQLQEVVFYAEENPAHAIIRKVVENRKINNPEKIKSFTYKSYNKFVVDAEIDPKDFEEDDPDDDDFLSYLETKYIFLMESVTERKYKKPDRSKEIVLANRVSGFKNPLFTTLANSFQPFSFYNDYLKVGTKKYLNPISPGSIKKYFFTLQDSIYSGENKVYIITFEPRKDNFDGLTGILYINTFKYAIENVIAETDNLFKHMLQNARVKVNDEEEEKGLKDEIGDGINDSLDELSEEMDTEDSTSLSEDDYMVPGLVFKVQQKYSLIDGEYWFPEQLNTDIIIGDNSGENGSALKGVGRSYLTEINLFEEVKNREFDRLSIEYAPRANTKDSSFWAQYRVEPLTTRGMETYEYLDSIGEEAKLDRAMNAFAALTTGKIPVKWIDIDVNRFADFNLFESLRLGFGAHTNRNFSRWLKVGGYAAYGFRDKGKVKYGGDATIFITKRNELAFNMEASRDVMESGSTQFYLDSNPLSSERLRRFMISNMDRVTNFEGGFSFYFLKYLDAKITFSQNTKTATSTYEFVPDIADPASSINEFKFAEARIKLKYSFREKYIEVLGNKVSLGTKYPVIWVNYTRGFDDIAGGQFDYHKVDLKVQKSFVIRGFGEPSFVVKAGYTMGDLPYTNLYNGNGSYEMRLPLEAVNSFQTMRMNEFLSDKFAALYYTHKLGRVVIHPRRSIPEFLIVTNLAFGQLENPQQHTNYQFNTMEQGYYESGLAIRNLYNFKSLFGVGIGTYYRYGPYSLDRTIDNFAFKLTTKWTLKL